MNDFTADDYVRATAEALGLDPDDAVAYRHATAKDYPLTSGQEIDSRQTQRSGRAPVEGPVPDSAVRPSGPSGSRCESIATSTDGAVPHTAPGAEPGEPNPPRWNPGSAPLRDFCSRHNCDHDYEDQCGDSCEPLTQADVDPDYYKEDLQ